MQNEQPYLTIAIPTYNRSFYVSTLVDKLTVLVADIGGIEILVSNNGSTDDTLTLLEPYSRSGEIKLVGFDENQGFDKNYLNCISKSSGEYVWVLGDDDIPSNSAIQEVLDCLHGNRPDFLVINGGGHGPSDALAVRIKHFPSSPMNFSKFLGEIGWHATWISVSIMRRKYLVTDQLNDFCGSGFIHVAIICNSFLNCSNIYFLRSTMIYQSENGSGYGLDIRVYFGLFGPSLCKIMDSLPKDIVSDQEKKRFLLGHSKQLGTLNFGTAAKGKLQKQIDLSFVRRNFNTIRRISITPWSWYLAVLLPRWFLFSMLFLKRRYETRL